MSVQFPECPASLRGIQHYLKTAAEHDTRDPVVSYWCRLHALQVGLKLTAKKTPEETMLLMALMDWLEKFKKDHKENEAISNEVAAQAHLENYALKLFTFADKMDREQNYNKNVVKAFYTAGMIYDVLQTFGELTEEVIQNRKYAKWKAAYIHNCLKNGETPVPGPMQSEDEDNNTTNEPANPTTSPADLPSNPEQNQPQTPGLPQTPSYSQQPPVFPQTPSYSQQPSVFPQPPSNYPSVLTPVDSETSLPDPSVVDQLPAVPSDPHQPGGFQPYRPQSSAEMIRPPALPIEMINKAQKYCKWATSALNYDDLPTAIKNLENALTLLKTGRDPA